MSIRNSCIKQKMGFVTSESRKEHDPCLVLFPSTTHKVQEPRHEALLLTLQCVPSAELEAEATSLLHIITFACMGWIGLISTI